MEKALQSEDYLNKPIFIIGNGVIAKALAVALAINGKKVTILRGSVEEKSAYAENIQVETGGKILSAEIMVSSMNNYDGLDGIILLTNKSFGNPELATKLKFKTKKSPIVFLQNGLHIENSFIEQDFSE